MFFFSLSPPRWVFFIRRNDWKNGCHFYSVAYSFCTLIFYVQTSGGVKLIIVILRELLSKQCSNKRFKLEKRVDSYECLLYAYLFQFVLENESKNRCGKTTLNRRIFVLRFTPRIQLKYHFIISVTNTRAFWQNCPINNTFFQQVNSHVKSCQSSSAYFSNPCFVFRLV